MKTRLRYLLVCDDRGIFIGTDTRRAFFSEHNSIGSAHAVTFESPEDAIEFGYERLSGGSDYEYHYQALPITLPKKKVHANIIDIVKAGYGAISGDMMDNLPASDTIH